MPKTLLLMSLLALLSPGKAVAGPPEGVSGKMVLDGKKVPSPVGVLLIRQTQKGMVVEGPGFQGRAARIVWLKPQGVLRLEGSEKILAELMIQAKPGKKSSHTIAYRLLFSLPEWRVSLEGNLVTGDR